MLFVGKAQEKASVFRTEKRRDAKGTYPWIIRSTAMVNPLLHLHPGPPTSARCSSEKCLDARLLDRRQRHRINAGRAAVLLDSPPCFPQDVTPVDAVQQCVRFLISREANLQAKNNRGQTPLAAAKASRKDLSPLIEILRAADATARP